MTLQIPTLNGQIETGFLSLCPVAFRFGEYTFPTSSYHKMLEFFADNQNEHMALMASCNKEFIERFSGSQIEKTINDIISEKYDPELMQTKLHEQIEQYRADLVFVKVTTPVDDSNISIGKYLVERSPFRILSHYAVDGGLFGWANRNYPTSAIKAKDAMKKTNRTLFKWCTNIP
jgi:hypothetical protein